MKGKLKLPCCAAETHTAPADNGIQIVSAQGPERMGPLSTSAPDWFYLRAVVFKSFNSIFGERLAE